MNKSNKFEEDIYSFTMRDLRHVLAQKFKDGWQRKGFTKVLKSNVSITGLKFIQTITKE